MLFNFYDNAERPVVIIRAVTQRPPGTVNSRERPTVEHPVPNGHLLPCPERVPGSARVTAVGPRPRARPSVRDMCTAPRAKALVT